MTGRDDSAKAGSNAKFLACAFARADFARSYHRTVTLQGTHAGTSDGQVSHF